MINLPKAIKEQTYEMLNQYKLLLNPNESMDSGNLKFVEQYLSKEMKRGNIVDCFDFMKDALDIMKTLNSKRKEYTIKFGGN